MSKGNTRTDCPYERSNLQSRLVKRRTERPRDRKIGKEGEKGRMSYTTTKTNEKNASE